MIFSRRREKALGRAQRGVCPRDGPEGEKSERAEERKNKGEKLCLTNPSSLSRGHENFGSKI